MSSLSFEKVGKTAIEIKAKTKARRFSDKIALHLQRQKELENILISEVTQEEKKVYTFTRCKSSLSFFRSSFHSLYLHVKLCVSRESKQ